MRGLIAAFALLMATGAVAVAAQENVAGTWNGTFSRGEFKEGFTMMLAQAGEQLTGTMSSKILTTGRGGARFAGREREDLRVEGTLVGNKLTLKIGKQDWLEGTVTGDSLTGQTGTANNAPKVVSARAK